MKKEKSAYLTLTAVIAALYAALTCAAAFMAFGPVQLRLSEALCVLPAFTPAGIGGVALGCFLAALVTGAPLPDLIFGTLATLLGALGTRALRRKKHLCLLPPVLTNALILPFVFRYAYGMGGRLSWYFLCIAAGEALSAGGLGSLLARIIVKNDYLRRLFSEAGKSGDSRDIIEK